MEETVLPYNTAVSTSITHFIGSVAFCLSPSFFLSHLITVIKLDLLSLSHNPLSLPLCHSLSPSHFLSLSLPKGFQITFTIRRCIAFSLHFSAGSLNPSKNDTTVVLTHLHSLTLLPFTLPHFQFSLSFQRYSPSPCFSPSAPQHFISSLHSSSICSHLPFHSYYVLLCRLIGTSFLNLFKVLNINKVFLIYSQNVQLFNA